MIRSASEAELKVVRYAIQRSVLLARQADSTAGLDDVFRRGVEGAAAMIGIRALKLWYRWGAAEH